MVHPLKFNPDDVQDQDLMRLSEEVKSIEGDRNNSNNGICCSLHYLMAARSTDNHRPFSAVR